MSQPPPTPGARARIIVGVAPNQAAAVVMAAALIADRFNAELICASVDESRLPVEVAADGTVTAMSFNPDAVGTLIEKIDAGFEARLAASLAGTHIRWTTRALAGGTSHALIALGNAVDATMFVVGTRAHRTGALAHEFFSGSVAVQLAHRQHRPVVVIPLSPLPPSEGLPWDLA